MVSKEKLDRINELAKIAKTRELTKEEVKEREALRKEYIQAFKKSFKQQLDSIEYVD